MTPGQIWGMGLSKKQNDIKMFPQSFYFRSNSLLPPFITSHRYNIKDQPIGFMCLELALSLEISQAEKDKYHISLICGILRTK